MFRKINIILHDFYVKFKFKETMKKRLIGIFLLLGVVASAMGQTNDRTSLGFYKMSNYPTCPRSLEARTYMVTQENDVLAKGSPAKALDLSGALKRVFNGTADITVQVTDTFVRSSEIVIEDNRYEIANRKVQGPPPPIQYIGRIYKDFGFTVNVKEGDRVIYTDNFSKNVKVESNWYRDPRMAQDSAYARAKKVTFRNVIKDYTKKLNKVLGTEWAMQIRLHFYNVRIKKKCTMDYSDLTAAAANFEQAFEIVKAFEYDIEKFKAAAQPSVDAWNKALKESNVNSESARINKEITCGLYYNLAIYHMFTKEFDLSEEYFMKAEKIAPGFGDAKRMAPTVERMKRPKAEYESMMKASGM